MLKKCRSLITTAIWNRRTFMKIKIILIWPGYGSMTACWETIINGDWNVPMAFLKIWLPVMAMNMKKWCLGQEHWKKPLAILFMNGPTWNWNGSLESKNRFLKRMSLLFGKRPMPCCRQKHLNLEIWLRKRMLKLFAQRTIWIRTLHTINCLLKMKKIFVSCLRCGLTGCLKSIRIPIQHILKH